MIQPPYRLTLALMLSIGSVVLNRANAGQITQRPLSDIPPAPTTITLRPGDDAPTISLPAMLKGDPAPVLEPNMVYVLSCWATWNIASMEGLAHPAELQATLGDKVVFLAVNVWETSETKAAVVVSQLEPKTRLKFVKGDSLFAAAWLKASGTAGLPTVFVVDAKGKLMWMGHPADLRPVLTAVVAGTYSPKQEDLRASATRLVEQRVMASLATGDVKGAIKVLDSVGAGPVGKFRMLLQAEDYTAAYNLGPDVYTAVQNIPQELNEIAWELTTDPDIQNRDLHFAKKLATRGVEITQRTNAPILDTLARIHFDLGEIDSAIDTQTEALTKAPNEERPRYLATLNRYKAAKKPK